MEIVKEISQWTVDFEQPNHTYLLNNKGQIVAYAKYGSNDIGILKSRIPLDKKYRKFVKTEHVGLSKLISKFNHEDKKEKNKDSRYFKVKSKDKEYTVELNQKTNKLFCSCIGFTYHGKCKHADAVAKKLH